MENRANQKQANELLCDAFAVVNVGLEIFEESLRTQGVQVVNVKWRPPREVSEDIKQLLDNLI
jgi:hypothetical protein